MTTFILNGWAASETAWNQCKFDRGRIFSYRDHLDGVTGEAFDAAGRMLLVGWSMGGTHAMELALRSPEKIAGLVLIATTPRMMKDAPDWPGMTERRIHALDVGLRMSVRDPILPVNPYAVDDEESLARGLDYLRTTDLRKRLLAKREALAGIPVSIFHSEHDAVVRSAHAEFIASVFASSRLTIIPGTEHALPVTIPALIDDAVKSMTDDLVA